MQLVFSIALLIQSVCAIVPAFAADRSASRGQLIDMYLRDDPKGDYASLAKKPVLVAEYITFKTALPLPPIGTSGQSFNVDSEGAVTRESSSAAQTPGQHCGLRLTALSTIYSLPSATRSLTTTSVQAGEKFAVLGVLDYEGSQIVALRASSGVERYLILWCTAQDSVEARNLLAKTLLTYSEN